MTPVDRLVRTRQQQRDSAAEELARAQARLRELQEEQERLTQESRDELLQAVGTDGLTIASLETMDAGRRQAERAATTGEAVLAQARQTALEYQRMLRQVEILRQRILDRRSDEERRRERRVLDEIASRRRGGGLLGLALVVAVGLGGGVGVGGCRGEEKHKGTEEASDAGHEAGAHEAGHADGGGDRGAHADRGARGDRGAHADGLRKDPTRGDARPDRPRKQDAMTFSIEELRQLDPAHPGLAVVVDQALLAGTSPPP